MASSSAPVLTIPYNRVSRFPAFQKPALLDWRLVLGQVAQPASSIVANAILAGEEGLRPSESDCYCPHIT